MISTSHLHPMLVHFPIAIVALGFLAELAALLFKKEAWLSRAGYYILLLGTLSALVAWSTGTFLTGEMSGTAGEVKDTHELFAWLTLGTLILASLVRFIMERYKIESPSLRWIAFSLYGLAFIFVSITGFYGGTLVYSYMMPL